MCDSRPAFSSAQFYSHDDSAHLSLHLPLQRQRGPCNVDGQFFPEVEKIQYEGPTSTNPMAFKWYNEDTLGAHSAHWAGEPEIAAGGSFRCVYPRVPSFAERTNAPTDPGRRTPPPGMQSRPTIRMLFSRMRGMTDG